MIIRALCGRLRPAPTCVSGLCLMAAILMLTGTPSGYSTHATPSGPAASCESSLVLSNVGLIDGNGGGVRSGVDIVIKGEGIARIVAHSSEELPPGARVLDLKGKYAIPGLIDGHVHLTNRPEIGLALMLRAGITAVRDMGGDAGYLREIQLAVRSGQILGPDIYFSALVAGPECILNDDRAKMSTPLKYELGAAPWMRIVGDSSDILQVVDDAIACGASGIKIYSHVSGDVVRRICSDAHERGVKVWAHSFVWPARPEEVIAAGVDVISHAEGLLYWPDWAPGRGQGFDPAQTKSERLALILDSMRAAGTMLDPTVLVTDEKLARNDSKANLNGRAAICEVVRLAHARGIPLAVGTDWPPPKSEEETPALYKELETLVGKSGLTPLQAVTAATRNNAIALGIADSQGTIEPGKVADIVILDKDPTVDIANISQVKLVIKNGRPLAPLSKGEAR